MNQRSPLEYKLISLIRKHMPLVPDRQVEALVQDLLQISRKKK